MKTYSFKIISKTGQPLNTVAVSKTMERAIELVNEKCKPLEILSVTLENPHD
ncbi:MAG: hypothetical protein V4547_08980 [Bacteroidota bacterium]